VAQTVHVDVRVIDAVEYVDIRSRERIERSDPFQPVVMDLPVYGYRFFEVLPSGEPRLLMKQTVRW
jgi:hypothetical protein